MRLYVDYEYHNVKAQFRFFNLTLPLKKWTVWRLYFLKTLHLVTIAITVMWRSQKYGDVTKKTFFLSVTTSSHPSHFFLLFLLF